MSDASSMPTASPTTQLGTILFRFRSFTPVPVLALVAWLLWRSRAYDGPGGVAVDSALNIAGFAVAALGQALRFFTLGHARDGTSGQGSILESKALNTRGPYAFVRNPLYVGNLGICLGLLLIANDPWAYILGLGFFFFEYYFIIRAEERFLLETHGAPYAEYLQRVPRWVPRFSPAYDGPLSERFSWSRALKKEHNPFTAWASGALLLLGWELGARGRLTPDGFIALAVADALVLISFAAIKAYKRGRFLRNL